MAENTEGGKIPAVLKFSIGRLAMQHPHRVIPSPEALFRPMDNEAVVLDLASASYFGLNEVGARFWQILSENPEFQRAHSTLLSEYEVEPDQLMRDLLDISHRLAEAGLARIE
jgi:hypothetical protein